MVYSYEPTKLIKAKTQILLSHVADTELIEIKPCEPLRNLVMEISRLELYQVKKRSKDLKAHEILMIAGYLPHNYYKVELNNLFLCFTYQSNPSACLQLFLEWQNVYDHPVCNEFIKNELQTNEEFILMIRKMNWTEKMFSDLLDSKHCVQKFLAHYVRESIHKDLIFEEKLKYFGVKEKTTFYKECEKLKLFFCSGKDYMRIPEEQMLAKIYKFTDLQLRDFLMNFLNVMSRKQLIQFRKIAAFFYDFIGPASSRECGRLFEKDTNQLIHKYRDWVEDDQQDMTYNV